MYTWPSDKCYCETDGNLLNKAWRQDLANDHQSLQLSVNGCTFISIYIKKKKIVL